MIRLTAGCLLVTTVTVNLRPGTLIARLLLDHAGACLEMACGCEWPTKQQMKSGTVLKPELPNDA